MPSLPIKQQLSRIKALRPGPKALLIEVCLLIENGGHGMCWATNPTLAAALGRPQKSISRLLSGLHEAGWLHVQQFPEQGNRREIRALPKTRRHYDPTEQSEDTPPAEVRIPPTSVDTPRTEVGIPTLQSEDTHLVEVRIPQSEDTLSLEVRIPIPQSGDRVSPEVRIVDYKNNTSIEKKKKVVVVDSAHEPSEDTTTTSFASLIERNKELADELEKLRLQLSKREETTKAWGQKKNAQIKQLKADLAQAQTAPPAPSSDAPPAPSERRKFTAEDSPLFLTENFRAFLERVNYGHVDIGWYSVRIQQKGRDGRQRTVKEWEDYSLLYLDKDAAEPDKLRVAKPAPSKGNATRPGRRRIVS